MKQIAKHRYMLEVLKACSPKLRKAILQNSDEELICVLAEIIVNLMEGNIKMSPSQKQKLIPFKRIFRAIVKQSCTAKVDKTKLRKQVVQTGGALPFLIPLIAPLIAKAALAGAVSTGVGVATKKILEG